MSMIVASILGTTVGVIALVVGVGFKIGAIKVSFKRMSKEERKKKGNLIFNGKKLF